MQLTDSPIKSFTLTLPSPLKGEGNEKLLAITKEYSSNTTSNY
jgi:hypothetical protein